MANKQQVLDLHHQHPDWSCQRIAAEIGAGREYVYSTFRRLGIKPPRAKPPPGPMTRVRPMPMDSPIISHLHSQRR